MANTGLCIAIYADAMQKREQNLQIQESSYADFCLPVLMVMASKILVVMKIMVKHCWGLIFGTPYIVNNDILHLSV